MRSQTADARYIREIDAKYAIQVVAKIEVRFIASWFSPALFSANKGLLNRTDLAFDVLQLLFDFFVAIDDPLLVLPIGLQRLAQDEYMFGAIVPNEGFRDNLFTGLDSRVAQSSETVRVTFTIEDRVDNR